MRSKEFYWFKLANTVGFGPKAIHYIYENLQKNGLTILELFEIKQNQYTVLFPELGKGRLSKANIASLLETDDDALFEDFQKLKDDGIYIVGMDDELYPKSVLKKMLYNAPPVIYTKGNLSLLNGKNIFITGDKEADVAMLSATKHIAYTLAGNIWNVVSGYMNGIDMNAHVGALEAGNTTTMVLSYGINEAKIKKEIKSLGSGQHILYISQFAPQEKFTGQHAMLRNRLAVALSQAVVIISSGPEKDANGKFSGPFDAAKTAFAMDIPVFVLSQDGIAQPSGSIDLIKMGGIAFTDGIEIVKYIEHSEENPEPPKENSSIKTTIQTTFNF